MNIEDIKKLIRTDQYYYSAHAEIERKADDLSFVQVEEAILKSTILEQYSDTGRGESCLLVGFSGEIPVHIVCGWRGKKIVLITLYVPTPPKFVDPRTRGNESDE